jgi:hypothetical protein
MSMKISEIIGGCSMTQTRVANIREKRNRLLAETDWYMMPDINIPAEKLEKVKAYRQELRDIVNKLVRDEVCTPIEMFDDFNFDVRYMPKLNLY